MGAPEHFGTGPGEEATAKTMTKQILSLRRRMTTKRQQQLQKQLQRQKLLDKLGASCGAPDDFLTYTRQYSDPEIRNDRGVRGGVRAL
jgi:hypothetical protein